MSPAIEETDLAALPSTTLLQSPMWGKFKAEFGWVARAFRVGTGAWAGEAMLLLYRRIGPLHLAYVPHAPSRTAADPGGTRSALEDLADALGEYLPASTVCVRFDPLWPAASPGAPARGAGRVRKAPVDVQPASTVLIGLRDRPDDLLAAMHKKNRYNIRVAERHGVEVSEGAQSDLPAWYGLYEMTAARDRIGIHSMRYYARLFELAREFPDTRLRLFLARHQGDLLAGIIVAETGEQATYLYGASSNEKRNLMPNYALQWRAILAARESGMTSYDLFGIPRADDPSLPMHGLYRFKTGFGGNIVHRVGTWDVVRRPGLYSAYRAAERGRSLYHHRLKKVGAR
jgi:lipid II:glycine glycyltransferase (peptidoglycan interpeptide bridge formation enzyme)